MLIKAVKELNNLISSSKNSFGGIEMDKNKLSILKKNIENLKFLEYINFKEIKELDLSYNEISDIKVLEKVKFEKLEKLNLRYNQIWNINILENVNFN